MIVEVHYGGGKGYSTTVASYDEAVNAALNGKIDEKARLIVAKDGEETIFTYVRYPRTSDGQLAWKFRATKKGY